MAIGDDDVIAAGLGRTSELRYLAEIAITLRPDLETNLHTFLYFINRLFLPVEGFFNASHMLLVSTLY